MRVGVIGAGPAGLTAAKILAEKGHEVDVYDLRPFGVWKPCGGVVTARSLRILREVFGSEIAEMITEMKTTITHYGDLEIEEKYPAGAIYFVDRKKLERFMIKEASKAGAEMYFRCPVKDVNPRGKVHTCLGEREYDVVIGADGPRGITRSVLGIRQKMVAAFVWDLEEIVLKPGEAHMFIQPGKYGYAWAFQRKDGINLGFGGAEGYDYDLAYKQLVELVGRRVDLSSRRGGYVPVGPPHPFIHARDRLLLVGDSLGTTDVLFAEGIYNALLTGKLAALAAQSSNPARKYSLLLRRHLPRINHILSSLLAWANYSSGSPELMSSQKLNEIIAKIERAEMNYLQAIPYLTVLSVVVPVRARILRLSRGYRRESKIS